MRSRLIALLIVGVLVVVACSDDSGEDSEAAGDTSAPSAEPEDFSGRGPYAVGEVDLQIDAEHPVAVFYPVDPDVVADDAEPFSYSGEDLFGPAIAELLPGSLVGEVAAADTWVGLPASGDGPFPVVLFSPGYGSSYQISSFHHATVASWGHVVVAVDHPERGIVSALGLSEAVEPFEPYLDSEQLLAGFDLVVDEAADGSSPLAGAVDAEQLATQGESAGGPASGTVAYDDRVDLWMGQAPGAPLQPDTDLAAFEDPDGQGYDAEALLAATEPPDLPSLIIVAEGDDVVTPDEVQQTWDWLEAPKRLAVLAGSGHAVWTDVCPRIRDEGGLSGFVEGLGLNPADVPIVQLGEDGCLPEDTDPELVWPLIDHLTVAQLTEIFGDDPAVGTASLEREYLDETFPGLLLELQSETAD